MTDVLTDLRSHRVYDIAIFDLVLSIVAAEYIFRYFGYQPYTGALLAIPIGVLAHALFGIDTELNYKLGISNKPIR